MIESMLAERIVSLSWRLQRAERMQNEATDCLIEEDHLPLTRMVTKRWSGNLKIIEKLFMHERRIESSMNRIITKLKKLQIIRRTERQDAEQQRAAQAAAAFGLDNDFAKQSQFVQRLIDRASFVERHYNKIANPKTGENKANFENPFLPEQPKIERGERFCADEEMIRSATSP